MHVSSIAVTGTVKGGKLAADFSAFPDNTEVIVVSREYFYQLAGSDSTRHQLEQAQQALQAVADADLPEQAKAAVERVLGVKRNEI